MDTRKKNTTKKTQPQENSLTTNQAIADHTNMLQSGKEGLLIEGKWSHWANAVTEATFGWTDLVTRLTVGQSEQTIERSFYF